VSIVQSALDRVKASRPTELPSKSASKSAGRGESVPHGIAWPQSSAPAIDINTDRLREFGMFPSSSFVRRQQDDYRSLRREVIAATQQSRTDGSPIGPIVVVTSALPGEGKSYTAINLAMSIASEGTHEVLLIDGDTVRCSLTNALGMTEEAGLLDLLSRPGANFMSYVRRTSNLRLHVLSAGKPVEGAGDLFSAGRIEPLFEAIASELRGHVVIVDTPPILLSSDTPVLTDAAGQVVLVVRAGQTLQDSITEASSRINERVPVGVVLNGWDPLLPSEKQAYRGYQAYERKY
jgi:protein-tyrosine kinase